MMPGDIPCDAPCANGLCGYCICGQCTDNAPCERQMDENGNLTHDDQS